MFLATEVLFFGGLFGAYTVYRLWYPAEFEFASSHLNRFIATVNTLFLITSSLTITLGIRAAKLGQKKALIRYLLVTAAFGTAFMVMKGFEYAQDFHEKFVPGTLFTSELESAKNEINAENKKRFEAGRPLLSQEEITEFKFTGGQHHWAQDLAKQVAKG